MYNTIEDYDENEFEKYEDDLDDEVEAMYFEEEPESEDDYDGEFIGDEGTPDRSVLLSVNDRGATLDDVQSDMKNRMRSFPQEISGPKDIAVIMSQGSNSLSLMPANVQMMQPTLISLDNDSFIEGKIYKKGTVLEIFTEAEQSSFSKDRDSRMDRSILAVSKSLAKDRPISQAQVSPLDSSEQYALKNIVAQFGNNMKFYGPPNNRMKTQEYEDLIKAAKNGEQVDPTYARELIDYMYSQDLL